MYQVSLLAQQIATLCISNKWQVITAESCTGGWVAQSLTEQAGSSQWFDRGLVTYSNQAKMDLLKVNSGTLDSLGAVSEATAREMAVGAASYLSNCCSLSITGIAGPGGGSETKPVGLVWFAWQNVMGTVVAKSMNFTGDRTQVRKQAVLYALKGAIDSWQPTGAG